MTKLVNTIGNCDANLDPDQGFIEVSEGEAG